MLVLMTNGDIDHGYGGAVYQKAIGGGDKKAIATDYQPFHDVTDALC